MAVSDRLARFVCRDCGRDWKQYTHEGKDVPCIRCGSANIEERPIQSASDETETAEVSTDE